MPVEHFREAHYSFVFLDEVTGTPLSERITASAMYDVIKREFLATALPGRIPKQAPRMLITMLSSTEDLVVDPSPLWYLWVFAWWLSVRSLATLRLSVHRGTSPSSVKIHTDGPSSRLTRSKSYMKVGGQEVATSGYGTSKNVGCACSGDGPYRKIKIEEANGSSGQEGVDLAFPFLGQLLALKWKKSSLP